MSTSRHMANEEKTLLALSAHHLRHRGTLPGGQRWQKRSPLQHGEPGSLTEHLLEHREAKEGGCSPSNGKYQPPQPPGPSKAQFSRWTPDPALPSSLPLQPGSCRQDGILLAQLLHKSFPTLHPPCGKTLNGEGNGNPLQYSCLETPMDGGTW